MIWKKGSTEGRDTSEELMEKGKCRRQSGGLVCRWLHVMQADRYLPPYCGPLSDIRGGEYVSWSMSLLTFPF